MTVLRRLLPLVAAVVLAAGDAMAQDAARDPRLRVVPFEADQIVTIDGHLGYQTMIEFDPSEQIENVSIGDSLGWQVTPNRAATLLFLKPTQANAATNMTVVTNRRRYAFALRTRQARGPDDPDIVYSLRFTYPPDAVAADTPAAPDPATFNFAYAISGSRALTPTRVFDDGRFTYFQMPPDAMTPAIFALNEHGEEEVVNAQVRGDYTVVDQIAATFVLRYGRDRTIVRNAQGATDREPARHQAGGRP